MGKRKREEGKGKKGIAWKAERGQGKENQGKSRGKGNYSGQKIGREGEKRKWKDMNRSKERGGE